MSVQIKRGPTDDAIVNQIVSALAGYQSAHPAAEIDVYRHSGVSVRIRVIDPDLAPLGRAERHALIWRALDGVSDDAQGDISAILPLTPEEARRSFASTEFDNPVPAVLG